MKNLFSIENMLVGVFVAMSCLFFVPAHSGISSANDVQTPEDSTLNVIGGFDKNDTLVYSVFSKDWVIINADTIPGAAESALVRLNVVDQTAAGFKMEYTLLDLSSDTVGRSPMDHYRNLINEKYARKIIGTTVQFETDEYGAITKITNKEQLKNRLQSIYSQIIDDLADTPEMKAALKSGVSLKELAKTVDGDRLLNTFTSELRLMLSYHGKTFKLGHQSSDNEDSQFDLEVELMDDEGAYCITSFLYGIAPKSKFGDVLGDGFISNLRTEDARLVTESLTAMGEEVPCEYSNYRQIKYTPFGFPLQTIEQNRFTMAFYTKIDQTVVQLESYTFDK